MAVVFGDVRLPVEVGKVGARVLVLAVHEQLRANQSLPPKTPNHLPTLNNWNRSWNPTGRGWLKCARVAKGLAYEAEV